ncbi:WecB/TagA/CpsF family glycosyltransferase [Rhodococcus sp. SJ-3]|uniref:WecB/TagA/CpsF family glycosyltransferase n=1 Tax=Rhodococcus sp. SJ-3 TaxID=3454628 RepID=UPI003F7ADDC7
MESISIGRIHSNPETFEGSVKRILALAKDDRPHLVVTPNIAHVYQSRADEVLCQAYESADFAPPDGWPVVTAIRLLADEALAVERVAGSDLLLALCKEPVSVALIGGSGDSATVAAGRLSAENPDLRVALTEPVPRAELEDQHARADLIARIRKSAPDIIFIGLGAPRQEALGLELLDTIDQGVIMCVGASIEFAAGTLRRAPVILRKYRMEWFFRLMVEPRKLARRYMLSAPYFVTIVILEKARRSRKKNGIAADVNTEGLRFDRLIIHQFDPARPSPGGIDTCIRGLLAYAPTDLKIGVIGVDTSSAGNRCGNWEKHNLGGSDFWFMPVAHLDPADQVRRVPHSVRLVGGLLKYRARVPRSAVIQAHRMDTALSIRALMRKPLAYFVHTQESGLTGSTSDSMWRHAGRIHAKLERFVVRRSSKVFVFNEDYAELVSSWNPAAEFSPTWFDPRIIDLQKSDRDSNRVVWVGRLEEPKDPILALRAFEELVRLDPDQNWSLDILGTGTLLNETRRYATEMVGSDRVTVHGRVAPEAVASIMARSEVFLMTSHPGYEGYPRVLVEALASGAAAVVTTGADTGALVRNGSNGFTAESRDPAELATLIAKAASCSGEAPRRSVEHLEAPAVVARIFKSQIGV